MIRRLLITVVPPLAVAVGVAYAQYPITNMIGDKVIQKYQPPICEQLWQEKAQKQGKPMPEGEQRAVKLVHEDPQMRTAFINKIAAPVLS